MNCYFSKNYKNLNNAGNKAKTDIEKILQQEGFKNIGLQQTTYSNAIISFFLMLTGILKTALSLRKGDVLLIQYPLKKYYTFICRIARLKGAKTITLIHDLGSFRRQKLTVSQEIKHLNRSHYIIAHNASMAAWLKEQGCRLPIGCLEIFDYLSPQPTPERNIPANNYAVVYAGGLSPRKNTFLYELGEHITNYHIHLYGKGFETQLAKGKEHFIAKGFIPSDELICKVDGDFGLVWDGDSLSGCSGNWGEYLKYNNPHKTSLYIRCELPVIIWKEAALASFVEENRIGICIHNLKDLNHQLSTLSPEEYNSMKKNVTMMEKNLADGYYTKKSIHIAVQYLSSNN